MCDAVGRLFQDASRWVLAPGESLFHRGDPVVSMFLLRSGRVDLVRHGATGTRMILQRADAGSMLAEASAWSDAYHCDAVVVDASEAAVLPRTTFRARIAGDPRLAEALAMSLARSVQAARLRAEIRSLPKVAERLDAWLGEGNSLPERGRWHELAAELSVTRARPLYREAVASAPSTFAGAGPVTVASDPHRLRRRTADRSHRPGPKRATCGALDRNRRFPTGRRTWHCRRAERASGRAVGTRSRWRDQATPCDIAPHGSWVLRLSPGRSATSLSGSARLLLHVQ